MAIAARVVTHMKLDAASNGVPVLPLLVVVAAALDDAALDDSELGAVLVAAVPDAEAVDTLVTTGIEDEPDVLAGAEDAVLLVVCVEALDTVLVVTKLVS